MGFSIKLKDRFFPRTNKSLTAFENYRDGSIVPGKESPQFENAGDLANWYEMHTPKENNKK